MSTVLQCSSPENHFGLLVKLSILGEGFLGGTVVENPPARTGDARDSGLIPESGRSPGIGTCSGLLVGEFHGQRSLVGYSPWVHKESDMTEHLT